MCNVLSLAQCMVKDMGKGSDMQGTPPRDLRVFSFTVSVYTAILWDSVCVFVSSCLGM